jgi:hypothetical protein
VAVLDGGRLRGWLPAGGVNGHPNGGAPTSPIDVAHLRPFAVNLRPTSTRREALDALLSSPTRVAVVVDDDERYLGMLDVDRIVEGLDAPPPERRGADGPA